MCEEDFCTKTEYTAAYDKALRLLGLRAHSEKELENKLCMKFSKAAARDAVERCIKAGFLNDEEFAKSYAEELYRRKGFSANRIYSELLKKGISRETANNVTEDMETDTADVIERTLEKMHITEDSGEKDIARAIRRLINMGYDIRDIKKFL